MATLDPIEMQKHLKGMDYPASRDDLVAKAEENGADASLLAQLRGTGNQQFTGPDDVMKALGGS